jgi:hypothetical protein
LKKPISKLKSVREMLCEEVYKKHLFYQPKSLSNQVTITPNPSNTSYYYSCECKRCGRIALIHDSELDAFIDNYFGKGFGIDYFGY